MTGAMEKYIADSCPYALLYGQQGGSRMRAVTALSRPRIDEQACETCSTEIAPKTISIARVYAMNLDGARRFRRLCICNTGGKVFTNEKCVREANDYT